MSTRECNVVEVRKKKAGWKSAVKQESKSHISYFSGTSEWLQTTPDLWRPMGAEHDASYIIMHQMLCNWRGKDNEHVRARRREPEKARVREQMEVREKVKTVKREWKRDDITKKMLSWNWGLVDKRGLILYTPPSPLSLFFIFLSLLRCTVQVLFPSLHGELMEGGLNILNSSSLSVFPSILLYQAFFFFPCSAFH